MERASLKLDTDRAAVVPMLLCATSKSGLPLLTLPPAVSNA
jgi:hypothetical protein